MKTKRMNFNRINPKTNQVEKTGYMEIKDSTFRLGIELYIYGDIVSSEWGAWSRDDVYPQAIADFMADVDNNAEMTIYINSGGGEVFAGIAIYNILKRHIGHKRGVVDGLAASIASVILMACDEIVMSHGTQIMIHKPSTVVWGDAEELQKTIKELDKCQQSITSIYMQRVKEGVTEEEITALINAETWFDEKEAQEIFDITVVNEASTTACVSGWIMNSYKNKSKCNIKTQTVADFEAKQREEAEIAMILDDLELYGT